MQKNFFDAKIYVLVHASSDSDSVAVSIIRFHLQKRILQICDQSVLTLF